VSARVTHNFDANAIGQRVNSALLEGTLAILVRVQNEAVTLLGQPGTGRMYVKGQNPFASAKTRRDKAVQAISTGGNVRATGFHRASAPGEPPAADTGNLRRNVTVARPRMLNEKDKVGWRIGIGVKYARALEYGFLPRRLLPRPYARPAIAIVKKEARKIITNALIAAGFKKGAPKK
jgi:hypothetical protein